MGRAVGAGVAADTTGAALSTTGVGADAGVGATGTAALASVAAATWRRVPARERRHEDHRGHERQRRQRDGALARRRGAPASASRSAATASPADAKRRSGSRASARLNQASTALGSPGRALLAGSKSRPSTVTMRSAMVSPPKHGCPASASYATTPSAHRSLRASITSKPRICSGLMYAGDSDQLADRGLARPVDRQVAVQRLGDAEVRQLRQRGAVGLLLQHHVRRLDVAVQDARRVRRVERVGDLREQAAQARWRMGPDRLHLLVERAAADVLHDQVGHALVQPGVVHRDHVLGHPRQLRRDLRLQPEAIQRQRPHRGVGGDARVHELDGDLGPELLVLGEPDLGHPAGRQVADQPVPPRDD